MIESVLEWERRRAMLSHDVLKNQVKQSVLKLCNVLAHRVSDPGFTASFSSEAPDRIERLCDDVCDLADRAESDVSPRCYFDESPLCDLDDPCKEWLSDTVHRKWLDRCEVRACRQLLTDTCTRIRQDVSNLGELLVADLSASSAVRATALLDSLGRLAEILGNMSRWVPYRE